jgi:hypothetical protein
MKTRFGKSLLAAVDGVLEKDCCAKTVRLVVGVEGALSGVRKL